MLNSFKLSLQYILPKLWLTRLAGWGASKRAGWLTKLVIDLFVKYYKVDMKEAQKPDTASYRTFNEFFVRPLRDEVRPIDTDPNVLVMPADGVISQLGKIEEDKILQAKGHNYSLEALLAGNYLMADLFRNGTFVTTYLSPRDYHRVHMPCNGILREMIYVPGDLFSVNHLTAQNVPNLFARNERVICLFDTEFGPMAQIQGLVRTDRTPCSVLSGSATGSGQVCTPVPSARTYEVCPYASPDGILTSLPNSQCLATGCSLSGFPIDAK